MKIQEFNVGPTLYFGEKAISELAKLSIKKSLSHMWSIYGSKWNGSPRFRYIRWSTSWNKNLFTAQLLGSTEAAHEKRTKTRCA